MGEPLDVCCVVPLVFVAGGGGGGESSVGGAGGAVSAIVIDESSQGKVTWGAISDHSIIDSSPAARFAALIHSSLTRLSHRRARCKKLK